VTGKPGLQAIEFYGEKIQHKITFGLSGEKTMRQEVAAKEDGLGFVS